LLESSAGVPGHGHSNGLDALAKRYGLPANVLLSLVLLPKYVSSGITGISVLFST